jgi:hypothetical protein
MALFSRRYLQRVLDENATFLTGSQLQTAVGLLNSVCEECLAKEWETVIINAASKCGTVEHEPGAEGQRAPDIFFRSVGATVQFIADVATISDRGFNRENPFDVLDEEFSRHLGNAKLLLTGGFHLQVDENRESGTRGSNRKVRLKLPPVNEFRQKIFTAAFFDFLRAVKADPERLHRFDLVAPDVGIHITYDPAKRGYHGGGHRAFDVATVIDRNPVYNALKNKGDQLKAVPFAGIRGIFLCDGGCQMLRSTPAGWSSYSVREVVTYFFQQFDSVTFILCLAVRTHSGLTIWDQHISIEPTLYVNPKAKSDSSSLRRVLEVVASHLPQPEWTPENAMHHLQATRSHSGRYIGTLKSGGPVKMSARMLLEILAGRRTLEDFGKEYSFDRLGNPFSQMLDQGRLISEITIEKHPDKDDDVAVIEFRGPDAAVSPFSVRRTEVFF